MGKRLKKTPHRRSIWKYTQRPAEALILTLNYLTPVLSFIHWLSWWLSPWSDLKLTLKLTWKLTLITSVLTMSWPFFKNLNLIVNVTSHWSRTLHTDNHPDLKPLWTWNHHELDLKFESDFNQHPELALILTLVLTLSIILTIFCPHF